MHWPPPPPCLQPFWLLRSVLPERTAQACQRWFIPQLLAHANQFSCLCFDPLFAFFPPLSLYLLYKQVSFVCSCFFAKLTPSSCQSVFLSFFLKCSFICDFFHLNSSERMWKCNYCVSFLDSLSSYLTTKKKRKKKRCEMSTTTVENPVVIWWRELQFKAS